MYGSSNDKRLSSNVSENISSSSIHTNQNLEEQSSVQKEEKVKSTSLRKLDGLISQTGGSSFGKTEITRAEEEDCSMSSFDDDDDDDDDTDDEYDHEELLLEFQNS
jgi:hypothetical protein